MDMAKVLLKEHSKKQTLKIVRYVGSDSKRFAKLMHLFLGSEYRVTQRAAWAVRWCSDKNPLLIKPWLKPMVMNLTKPDLPVAVKRNSMKILSDVNIPSSIGGLCVELCFKFLRSKDETIAVKVFSMSVLSSICKKHPELKTETKLVINDLMIEGSAGIQSRGKKVLKQLEKV